MEYQEFYSVLNDNDRDRAEKKPKPFAEWLSDHIKENPMTFNTSARLLMKYIAESQQKHRIKPKYKKEPNE